MTTQDTEPHSPAEPLGRETQFERIHGQDREMPPVSPPHAAALRRWIHHLSDLADDRFLVDAKNPIRLDDESQPRPDIALLRPQADHYATDHPGPESVVLLIEITTPDLAAHRRSRLELYAEFSVPEVWLADAGGSWVEMHCRPVEGAYTETRRVEVGSPEELVTEIASRLLHWI